MNKRPLSVTVVGCIFIAAGVVGFAYHVTGFRTHPPLEVVWVCLLRLLAILGGVFVLRAKNWARWLVLAWLAYHVALSAFHQVSELIMHALLFAIIAYILFRRPAAAYFRNTTEAGR